MAPESATAPYPGVTATLTEAVLHPDNAAHMADMAYHTHASPWLQALVKANSGNRCATKIRNETKTTCNICETLDSLHMRL